MSRVLFCRTLPYEPEDVMDVFVGFSRYPSFVPGVVHIKQNPLRPTVGEEAAEVEAFLKNSKFSGTVRVAVETSRSAGTVTIKPKYGPFQILSGKLDLKRLQAGATEVRFSAELTSAMAALNSIINQHFKAAALAYAEVFIAEVGRRARSRSVVAQ